MSDVAQLWWSLGSTLGALALVWAYTRLDLRRFRRRLAAKEREEQRLHDEEMRRRDVEFCAWMDDFMTKHFEEFPVQRD